ncbi:MAG: lysophospholipid acyltransferase family protein [bacterium]
MDYIVYLIVVFFALLVRLLPLTLAIGLGESLSIATFYLDKKHRQRTISNLKMVFGKEKTPDEMYEIAKAAYRTVGRGIIEFLWIPKLNREKIKSYVSYEGLENLHTALNKNKGILCLAAHFGSWELGPIAHSLYGYPSSFVARPIDNIYLDKWINKYRCKFGNKVIPKKNAIRHILRDIRNKRQVGILIDQNTSPRESVFVKFFNKICSTTPLLAVIALKTGAPVLPTFTVPNDKGKHTILIGPEIKLDIKGELERDIIVNTQIFTKVIEDIIRQYPECWFWMHRRWKTQIQEQIDELKRVRMLDGETPNI